MSTAAWSLRAVGGPAQQWCSLDSAVSDEVERLFRLERTDPVPVSGVAPMSQETWLLTQDDLNAMRTRQSSSKTTGNATELVTIEYELMRVAFSPTPVAVQYWAAGTWKEYPRRMRESALVIDAMANNREMTAVTLHGRRYTVQLRPHPIQIAEDDGEVHVLSIPPRPKGVPPPPSDKSSGAHLQTCVKKGLPEALADLVSCPITKEVLWRPVVAADGVTYEERAIVEWWKCSNLSPKTGAPLANFELHYNESLRKIIAELAKDDPQDDNAEEEGEPSARSAKKRVAPPTEEVVVVDNDGDPRMPNMPKEDDLDGEEKEKKKPGTKFGCTNGWLQFMHSEQAKGNGGTKKQIGERWRALSVSEKLKWNNYAKDLNATKMSSVRSDTKWWWRQLDCFSVKNNAQWVAMTTAESMELERVLGGVSKSANVQIWLAGFDENVTVPIGKKNIEAMDFTVDAKVPLWICPPEFGPAPEVTVTCLMQRLHATAPAPTAPPDRPGRKSLLNPCPGDIHFWRDSLTWADEKDPQEPSAEERRHLDPVTTDNKDDIKDDDDDDEEDSIPTMINKMKQRRIAKGVDGGAVDTPTTGYREFLMSETETIRASHPWLTAGSVQCILRDSWQELTQEERDSWARMADEVNAKAQAEAMMDNGGRKKEEDVAAPPPQTTGQPLTQQQQQAVAAAIQMSKQKAREAQRAVAEAQAKRKAPAAASGMVDPLDGKMDDDDPLSITNMIAAKKQRTARSARIAHSTEAKVDAMMDNGVEINPLLRTMYGTGKDPFN